MMDSIGEQGPISLLRGLKYLDAAQVMDGRLQDGQDTRIDTLLHGVQELYSPGCTDIGRILTRIVV